MTVSRDAVLWGFRLVLGREAESEAGIQAHCALADEDTLIEVLLRSPEFKASRRFSSVLDIRAAVRGAPAKPWAHHTSSRAKVAIFGNCQITGIGRLMQAMTGDVDVRTIETTPTMLTRLKTGDLDVSEILRRSDIVFVQQVGEVLDAVRERFPGQAHKLRVFPAIAYAGFHPDSVYATAGGRYLSGCMGEYHSAIVLYAWRQGLSVDQTVDLFRGEVFDSVHYGAYHEAGYTALVDQGRAAGFPLASHIDAWRGMGCWMHTINHPKIAVLADVASTLLKREGIDPIVDGAAWVEDPLLHWPVWPVYPELAQRVGLQGSYTFKLDRGLCPERQPVLTMDLPAFVAASFNTYRQQQGSPIECPRIDLAVFAELRRFIRDRPSRLRGAIQAIARAIVPARPEAIALPAGSPYEGLPDAAYWRRAVARVAHDQLDPVRQVGFRVERTDRVATGGSCFAQHIARTLQRQGFNYFVADADDSLSAEERERLGVGVFSARYGNLYTARQLVQLFDRAFGEFAPAEPPWLRSDGRYVDPFRPQIEPAGFDSPDDVTRGAAVHLQQVRRMFTELDVFVFTLGLTEAWRRRDDGAVFPLAPGVVAGRFDPEQHEFVNFSPTDVERDLRGFAARLRSVNPRSRIIFTVSPVPLIATYGDEHVLVATAYSKAVLRGAAGVVARDTPLVDYFPSYEIITSAHSRGRHFEDDLRTVTEAGVAHVMRVFMAHYTGDVESPAATSIVTEAAMPDMVNEQRQLGNTVCDEEAIERHRG